MAEVAQVKSLETSLFSGVCLYIGLLPAILPQQSDESKAAAMGALEFEFSTLQAYKLPWDILNGPKYNVQWAQVGNIQGCRWNTRVPHSFSGYGGDPVDAPQ